MCAVSGCMIKSKKRKRFRSHRPEPFSVILDSPTRLHENLQSDLFRSTLRFVDRKLRQTGRDLSFSEQLREPCSKAVWTCPEHEHHLPGRWSTCPTPHRLVAKPAVVFHSSPILSRSIPALGRSPLLPVRPLRRDRRAFLRCPRHSGGSDRET
jgi:hypothetical protein